MRNIRISELMLPRGTLRYAKAKACIKGKGASESIRPHRGGAAGQWKTLFDKLWRDKGGIPDG